MGKKNGAPNASKKAMFKSFKATFRLSPKDKPVLIEELLKEKEFEEDKFSLYADKKPTGEIAAPKSRRPWP